MAVPTDAAARDQRPWYAQPLLWAALSPLVVTVVAGVWLLLTATGLGGGDALPGEYAKTGKLIALDEAALKRSAALAPLASGRLEPDRQRVTITIAADDLPDRLDVKLVHATLPERDVAARATWYGEGWRAALPARLPERGELHVFPADRAWRLVAPITPDAPLEFRPSRR